MATITPEGSVLRHARKTVTFTGGAGAGAVGTVTVFTITGRVLLQGFTGYVSTGLTAGATATMDVGTASATTVFTGGGELATAFVTGDWLQGGAGSADGAVPELTYWVANPGGIALSQNIIITVGAEAISAGVIVFDIFYRPITDDGALAGTDIDTGVAVANVTQIGGTAVTAAAGIPEVKVASIAAAAVTEIWAKAMSDLAAVPGATASVLAGINWLFMLGRNKRTQSATVETVYKDDGSTAAATSTKSDSAGTFTRGEFS